MSSKQKKDLPKPPSILFIVYKLIISMDFLENRSIISWSIGYTWIGTSGISKMKILYYVDCEFYDWIFIMIFQQNYQNLSENKILKIKHRGTRGTCGTVALETWNF